jgi:hypothetical protein
LAQRHAVEVDTFESSPGVGVFPDCDDDIDDDDGDGILTGNEDPGGDGDPTNDDLKTAGKGNSGLEGGDNICNSHAQSAGLPGTFTAWLSINRINAQDRVNRSTGSYHLPLPDGSPGTKVVDNFADILECEGIFPNRICLDSPINRDENGEPVIGRTWTYTRESGNAFGNKDQDACGAWEDSTPGGACSSSSTGGCGRFGAIGNATPLWTSDSYVPCDSELRLYCFQD